MSDNAKCNVVCALLAFVIATAGACLLCYVFGKPQWTSFLGFAQMSFPTSLCLIALSFAIIFIRKP